MQAILGNILGHCPHSFQVKASEKQVGGQKFTDLTNFQQQPKQPTKTITLTATGQEQQTAAAAAGCERWNWSWGWARSGGVATVKPVQCTARWPSKNSSNYIFNK